MNFKRITCGLMFCIASGLMLQAADLEDGFRTPPRSAKPQTWWHWMQGSISREGITADLEAMKKIGLGGVQMLNISCGPQGNVTPMSDQWYDLVDFAASEADRLGLEFCIHNCPGWSSSGGPWVTPEYSMQMLVSSSVKVAGGKAVSLKLPQPYTRMNFYREVTVLAFPCKSAEGSSEPKISSAIEGFDTKLIQDNDWNTKAVIPASPDGKKSYEIVYDFEQPSSVRALSIVTGKYAFTTMNGEILVSDDGVNYTKACGFTTLQTAIPPVVTTVRFDKEVKARYFKIVFLKTNFPSWMGSRKTMELAEVKFHSEPQLDNWWGKAGFVRYEKQSPAEQDSADAIDVRSVVNLSSMFKDGVLNWQAPAGNWTVVRFGYTTRGKKNVMAPKAGAGLECDKLSAKAFDLHWDGMMKRMLAMGKGKIDSVLIDSYEAGSQNWTPLFLEEFRKRRTYDATPYLPAMAGYVVGSSDVSDRFLHDVRRTLADLFCDNYYGRCHELCRENGLTLYAEIYGNGNFDGLTIGEKCDIPMSEFWSKPKEQENSRSSVVASSAHIYGRKTVAAEAYTAEPASGRWQQHPYSMKTLGDREFCSGVNRYVFHRYAHQPWVDPKVKPGMTMGRWGLHFERTNTWWDYGDAWISYLTRCQYMLRQGNFVADVCVFAGENSPVFGYNDPKLPDGYRFDNCDANTIINNMSVRNGRIILKSGMNYDLLVIPPTTTMSLELASALERLVNDGANVLGCRPQSVPGLSGYPESEAKLKTVIERVFGNAATAHKGKVFSEGTADKALMVLGIKPDFTYDSTKARLNYIHRRTEDADIYFICNRQQKAVESLCSFRVTGKVPEIWCADTGTISPCSVYETNEGHTSIPLQFDPAESVFVVFQNKSKEKHLRAWQYKPQADDSSDKNSIVIKSAVYGVIDDPERSVDVTGKIRSIIGDGKTAFSVVNTLAGGDPARNTPKKLKMEFVCNGESRTVTLRERSIFDFSDYLPSIPPAECNIVSDSDQIKACVWTPGVYEFTTTAGTAKKFTVDKLPDALELTGKWNVDFQEGRGAPKSAEFDRLISWPDSEINGIKYFSGTAEYTRTFEVPDKLLADSGEIKLDLGEVQVIAEIRLNGKNLGVLWKPPFTLDVSDVLQKGENILKVKVVNLWANRIIGDEVLSDDQSCPHGADINKWLEHCEKYPLDNPARRITYSTYRHYRKDDALLKSGLIGPVVLRPGKLIDIVK